MRTLIVIALFAALASLSMQVVGFPDRPPIQIINQIPVPEVKVEPDVSVVAMPSALDKDTVAELLKDLIISVEAPNVTVAVPDQPTPIVNVTAPNCPRPPVHRARHWCPDE